MEKWSVNQLSFKLDQLNPWQLDIVKSLIEHNLDAHTLSDIQSTIQQRREENAYHTAILVFQNPSTYDEKALLCHLDALTDLKASINTIACTDIALLVDRLMVHKSEAIRDLALGLCRKWDEIVTEWTSHTFKKTENQRQAQDLVLESLESSKKRKHKHAANCIVESMRKHNLNLGTQTQLKCSLEDSLDLNVFFIAKDVIYNKHLYDEELRFELLKMLQMQDVSVKILVSTDIALHVDRLIDQRVNRITEVAVPLSNKWKMVVQEWKMNTFKNFYVKVKSKESQSSKESSSDKPLESAGEGLERPKKHKG